MINFWPTYLLYSVKTSFFSHKENSYDYLKHFKYLATFLMRNKCAATLLLNFVFKIVGTFANLHKRWFFFRFFCMQQSRNSNVFVYTMGWGHRWRYFKRSFLCIFCVFTEYFFFLKPTLLNISEFIDTYITKTIK